MKMAQRAYEASAKVIRTADEMSKTLLDTFA
jgi:flagellar hook protein FlgE